MNINTTLKSANLKRYENKGEPYYLLSGVSEKEDEICIRLPGTVGDVLIRSRVKDLMREEAQALIPALTIFEREIANARSAISEARDDLVLAIEEKLEAKVITERQRKGIAVEEKAEEKVEEAPPTAS